MPQILTIEVPEEVFRRLREQAEQGGTTPEAVAAELLARCLAAAGDDPLLKWAGAIDADVADVAERHDFYLGQAQAANLRGGGDG
jgi:hypothetical protein